MEELHPVQARVRDEDPEVLAFEADGNRLPPVEGLRTPGVGEQEGEEEVQSYQYEEVHGRLSRCGRGRSAGCHVEQCCGDRM